MEHIVRILSAEFETSNVKRFIIEKPSNYSFVPGQASLVSVNQDGWRDKKRPFTFTNLNEDLALEFNIKKYEDHEGVTKKIHSLIAGDELIIREPFGTINYSGKGTFIAGGAGITPFIAILRNLRKNREMEGNRLIFSNKTWKDIILERELKEILGDNLTLLLTREKVKGYEFGRIDETYLKNKITNLNQNFYICGPVKFVSEIRAVLDKLGARIDSIIFEGKEF